MAEGRRRSLPLLVLAGLCSFPAYFGLIFSFKIDTNDALRVFFGTLAIAGPGAFFGFTVSAYFVLYERVSSLARVTLFIAVCGFAFWVSFIGAIPLIPLFGGEFPAPFKGPAPISLPFLFGAGYIGAFLVIVTGKLVWGELPVARSALGRALLLSLAGGAAALAGGLLDPALADAIRSNDWQGITPLATWPPIGALLLGLTLNQEEPESEPDSSSSPNLN